MVGERFNIFGETPYKSLRSLVGQEMTVRAERTYIWLSISGRSEFKIKRGSLFEGFRENRCIASVHESILAAASADPRPSEAPPDAFALAARGEQAPHYRWFQCSLNSNNKEIACKKWSPKGAWNGVDRYCATTRQGESVHADFAVDRLLSREGHIVLQNGQTLQVDNRGRINDQLQRPGEPCHQTTAFVD